MPELGYEKDTPPRTFDSHAAALALQQEMFRQWERDPGTRGTHSGFADPKAQALYDALCAYTAPVAKPKERVRVHPEKYGCVFIQEVGERDLYLAKATNLVYAFPAVYEDR